MNNLNCQFCHEHQEGTANRFIYESEHFHVFPALGSFVAGYFLIVPKKHVSTVLALDRNIIVELQAVIGYFRDTIEIIYGKKAIVFENIFNKTGKHSTVHILPFEQTIVFEQEHFASKEYFDLVKMKEEYDSNTDYLLYQDNACRSYLIKTFEVKRYHMRERLCRYLKLGDVFDFQIYPFVDNMLKTVHDYNQIKNKKLFTGKLVEKRKSIMKYFNENFDICRTIFQAKTKDYGPTWIFFRLSSLIDQLWIKVMRIRTLEESNENLVGENIESEYYGIINYCIIGILSIRFDDYYRQLTNQMLDNYNLSAFKHEELFEKYDLVQKEVKELLVRKNHDYGDAWMEMRIESITDQIIIKTARIKKIMLNQGALLISENIDAQLADIINYAIFSLLKVKNN